MVSTRVNVSGSAFTFYRTWPERLRVGQGRINRRSAEFIRDAAKKRAPVWSGTLRDSIIIRKVSSKEIHIVATAPYAAAIELGYKPHRASSSEPTRGRSGDLIQTWLDDKGYVAGWRSSIFIRKWSVGARYMESALEQYRAQANRIISEEIGKMAQII